MFLITIIKNLGWILVGSAVLGIFGILMRAKIRDAREKREEIAKAEKAAEANRARVAEIARKAAEKEEAARRADAEKAREKAAKAAELERIRAEKAEARKAKQEEKAKRDAERLEAARQLAEYRERDLAAARELKALEASAPGSSAEAKQPETIPAETPTASAPVKSSADPVPVKSSKAFAGQIVSFTGSLKSMTRSKAIEMVKAAGGKAYESMPAGTTILVIGDTKGMNTNKMDKAAEWIGQVKRITEAQFLAMFDAA